MIKEGDLHVQGSGYLGLESSKECNVLKATGISSTLHFSWEVTNTAQDKVLLAKASMLYSSTNL